jgi:hypothetical protein
VRAEPRFLGQPKPFWANVRSISEKLGYTIRGSGQIRVPSLAETVAALNALGLTSSHIADRNKPTDFGASLLDYFAYRASILYDFVQHHLMDVQAAAALYAELRDRYRPTTAPPMNKQKGDKAAPAFFTAIINMLIEANAQGHPCNYNPQQLTTVTLHDMPLRTLARRIDGAFPSTVNPVAVWEIKEYYYTTTFGSRVADGVYESLLDGMELEEIREQEGIEVQHLLMVDGHLTWWKMGRSYLCRIIDMLHMGYVDEALFGREVVDVLPRVVSEWVARLEQRS